MKKTITVVLALITGFSMAQTFDAGKPMTFNPKVKKTTTFFETPGLDHTAEIARDEAERAQTQHKLYRFGKEFETDVNLSDEALATMLPNGDKLYQYGVYCPGALSVNVVFDEFRLTPGSSVKLAAYDGTDFIGSYTSLNNNQNDVLGSEVVFADRIIIELLVPKGYEDKNQLHLGTVVYGYRDINQLAKELNTSGDCNVDVNCPAGAGWEPQRNSVAMILVTSALCTGSLVNNTSGTVIPYFLTANHCSGNPANWVFRFRWEAPVGQTSCATTANSGNGPENMNVNGAVLRANNSISDFRLLELNTAPNPAWGIYYNGWDHSDALTVSTGTGIHHPDGDIKKICRENDALTHLTTSFNGNPNTEMWRIANWDIGVTEPGSSGSPLFDQNHRVIGVLSGGAAACSGTNDNNQYDMYGRFGIGWDGGSGSTASTRLRDWLDPSNTGSNTLDGVDPAGPPAANDGGLSSPQNVSGTICGTSITPEVTIVNNGSAILTSATITYSYDGGAAQIYTWNGSLNQYASETVTLPTVVLTGGAHTFEATVSNPNGTTDENNLNDEVSSSFTVVDNGSFVTLNLQLDCYGEETTWELRDNVTNALLYSGGPYEFSNNPPLEQAQFCLQADGCYKFTIFDDYGDGMTSTNCSSGSYTITSSTGAVLAEISEQDADFGTEDTQTFCLGTSGIHEITPDAIKLYPNPANDLLNYQTASASVQRVEIYSVTGQLVLTHTAESQNGTINVAALNAGMYIVKFHTERGIAIKQVAIE